MQGNILHVFLKSGTLCHNRGNDCVKQRLTMRFWRNRQRCRMFNMRNDFFPPVGQPLPCYMKHVCDRSFMVKDFITPGSFSSPNYLILVLPAACIKLLHICNQDNGPLCIPCNMSYSVSFKLDVNEQQNQ